MFRPLEKHIKDIIKKIAARVDVFEECVRSTLAYYNKTNSTKEKLDPVIIQSEIKNTFLGRPGLILSGRIVI